MQKRKRIGTMLDLPDDALYGAQTIHIMAGGRVYVENHRGVRDYTPEYLRFETLDGAYEIRGLGMAIDFLSRDTLLLSGEILSIACLGGASAAGKRGIPGGKGGAE